MFNFWAIFVSVPFEDFLWIWSSYRFYYVQSASSPILKPLVDWGHLVWGKFPLCYFKVTIYLHTNRVFLCWVFLNLVGMYFEHCGFHQKSFLLLCWQTLKWQKCPFADAKTFWPLTFVIWTTSDQRDFLFTFVNGYFLPFRLPL